MFKLILFIFIVVLLTNNVNAYWNGKAYIMETYDNEDCSGEVKIYRPLMYINRNLTFQTAWEDQSRSLHCNKDDPNLKRNPDKHCYWTTCLCNSDDCRKYLSVGECVVDEKGISSKLTYSRVNYNENTYCSITEGLNLVNDDVPLGFTIMKKNYCYRGIAYFTCNLRKIEIRMCDTNEAVVSFPIGRVVDVANSVCGYGELMFGSDNWWDNTMRKKPIFDEYPKSPNVYNTTVNQ